MLKAEAKDKIQQLTKKYPEGKQKSALIPALHVVQDYHDGWLDAELMSEVADILSITPIEVYEVATFYTMFNLKPVGKYILEVCQTGPCMLEGSDEIIEHIKSTLNINPGETTEDGLFTLKTVECLGACGYAPMMQLGKHYKEHLSKERIDEIIAELRTAAAHQN